MARVLVIDDEQNIRKTLTEILEDEAHEVLQAADGRAGLAAFAEQQPDVVVLDVKLPKIDGVAVLEEIKKRGSDCEVIMVSGHGTIESAVRAVKLGAYHFLEKPLSMIEVKQIVGHAADVKLQRDRLNELRHREDVRHTIVGESAALRRMKEEITKVAQTEGRVLITGESGTGKELVAYAIHKGSNRAAGPFIKVNCAAIPESLIESELFGHEKGAFTGAVGRRKGRFEMAHGGTLLLDEIGDMDLNTQTKVLRAIQEGEFERVGGTETVKVDVRILAATHRELEAMMAQGAFREDLYYRLCVVPIHVPSLGERTEDIPLLAEHLLRMYCLENGALPRTFAPDALALLARQEYPGNIRQLKNIVERVAIMCGESRITAQRVEELMRTKESRGNALLVQPRGLAQAKDELEREYVLTQLELNQWDIVRTAEILEVQRTNLYRKMRQLGIERK